MLRRLSSSTVRCSDVELVADGAVLLALGQARLAVALHVVNGAFLALGDLDESGSDGLFAGEGGDLRGRPGHLVAGIDLGHLILRDDLGAALAIEDHDVFLLGELVLGLEFGGAVVVAEWIGDVERDVLALRVAVLGSEVGHVTLEGRTLADEHDDLDWLVQATQELLRAVAQGTAVFTAEVETVKVLERVAVDKQQDDCCQHDLHEDVRADGQAAAETGARRTPGFLGDGRGGGGGGFDGFFRGGFSGHNRGKSTG